MEEITAKIDGIVFSNKQTGFYILKAIICDSKKNVTIRGTFFDNVIDVGLKGKFKGKFELHDKYGQQFVSQSCEIIPDKGRSGVIAYLSANVPSIGPITASRMYDALGDDLVYILENEPEKIRDLSFLNKKQIESILDEWSKSSESRTASIFLSDVGLTNTAIKSVFSHFGIKDVKKVILSNPYRLTEVYGIGFQTADSAARKIGIEVDDDRRVKSMILYALSEMSFSEGHLYSNSSQIRDYIDNKLFRNPSIDSFSHGRYIADNQLYRLIVDLKNDGSIISDEDNLYLKINWIHEHDSANYIADLALKGPYNFPDLNQILSSFESEKGITLSDEQKEAFLALSKSRVLTVSGYPGTGKTLLISTFVHLFEQMNMSYNLMSPTGIAAKRLSQVTGKPASTIHRSLGYGVDGTWSFHQGNKFHTDAVIVDEMSMVDMATFYHLVSALSEDTILIMVGDSAQLPSVGAGFVLNNLMTCNSIQHVALTKIYRQEEASDIIKVAHSILKNESVDLTFNKNSDFVFLNHSPDEVVNHICDLASALKEKGRNFQVVCPMYDGILGVNNLNNELRDILNPESDEKNSARIKQGEVDIYEGDRIMVVKNNYDLSVYNGDLGKVTRISLRNNEVDVKIFNWFDANTGRYVDKLLTLKVDEARNLLRVAYACTIHKCQGQEFDYVLMPMTSQYGIMLYKNLIYTAITRAKKKVFLIGDQNAFSWAVKNDRESFRNSNFDKFIDEITLLKTTHNS